MASNSPPNSAPTRPNSATSAHLGIRHTTPTKRKSNTPSSSSTMASSTSSMLASSSSTAASPTSTAPAAPQQMIPSYPMYPMQAMYPIMHTPAPFMAPPAVANTYLYSQMQQAVQAQLQARVQTLPALPANPSLAPGQSSLDLVPDDPLMEQSIRQAVYYNLGELERVVASGTRLVTMEWFLNLMSNWSFVLNSRAPVPIMTKCQDRLDPDIVRAAMEELYAYIPDVDVVILPNAVRMGRQRSAKSRKQQSLNRRNRPLNTGDGGGAGGGEAAKEG